MLVFILVFISITIFFYPFYFIFIDIFTIWTQTVNFACLPLRDLPLLDVEPGIDRHSLCSSVNRMKTLLSIWLEFFSFVFIFLSTELSGTCQSRNFYAFSPLYFVLFASVSDQTPSVICNYTNFNLSLCFVKYCEPCFGGISNTTHAIVIEILHKQKSSNARKRLQFTKKHGKMYVI